MQDSIFNEPLSCNVFTVEAWKERSGSGLSICHNFNVQSALQLKKNKLSYGDHITLYTAPWVILIEKKKINKEGDDYVDDDDYIGFC